MFAHITVKIRMKDRLREWLWRCEKCVYAEVEREQEQREEDKIHIVLTQF